MFLFPRNVVIYTVTPSEMTETLTFFLAKPRVSAKVLFHRVSWFLTTCNTVLFYIFNFSISFLIAFIFPI